MKTLDYTELCLLKKSVLQEMSERKIEQEQSASGKIKACPLQYFHVSNNIKFLDTPQLEELTHAFRRWLKGARNSLQRNSRTRVWFVFLLLRYAGMRLGEVLSLDEIHNIDYERSKIIMTGEDARQIYLPRYVSKEILEFISDKKHAEFRGKIFNIDPGFLRKKFYEQEKHCSIKKQYLSPSVLRNSRAVELLKQGVPLPLLKMFLGHQRIDLTAKYFNFFDNDADEMFSSFIS
jgi:molybdate transport system regulatory protein